jgi:hypothetical protein
VAIAEKTAAGFGQTLRFFSLIITVGQTEQRRAANKHKVPSDPDQKQT